MTEAMGRGLFITVVLLAGGGMYYLLSTSIMDGRPARSVMNVLLASPVLMAAAWLLVQRGQPAFSTFTLKNISYAATIADLLVLTTLVWFLAKAWEYHYHSTRVFFDDWLWMGISYILGLCVGVFFHFILGGTPDSHSLVVSEQLHDSATSWAHNLGVMPAIAGAVIRTLIPLFFTRGALKIAIGLALLLIVGWGGLVMLDTYRATLPESNPWRFNPQWLDTVMYWARWRPLL